MEKKKEVQMMNICVDDYVSMKMEIERLTDENGRIKALNEEIADRKKYVMVKKDFFGRTISIDTYGLSEHDDAMRQEYEDKILALEKRMKESEAMYRRQLSEMKDRYEGLRMRRYCNVISDISIVKSFYDAAPRIRRKVSRLLGLYM